MGRLATGLVLVLGGVVVMAAGGFLAAQDFGDIYQEFASDSLEASSSGESESKSREMLVHVAIAAGGAPITMVGYVLMRSARRTARGRSTAGL